MGLNVKSWLNSISKCSFLINTTLINQRSYRVPNCSLKLYNCRTMATDKNLNYNQLKELIQGKSIYLVDVRRKDEISKTGLLPDSVNIPLDELESALNYSAQEFEAKYGKGKPEKDSKIVFSCHSGVRSTKALQEATKLGYNNALNYTGGWSEWEQKSKTS